VYTDRNRKIVQSDDEYICAGGKKWDVIVHGYQRRIRENLSSSSLIMIVARDCVNLPGAGGKVV
jgi:hypothetical protein